MLLEVPVHILTFCSMLHQIVSFLLAPILLAQGKAVRKGIPVLPEPSGKRTGVSGAGPPLRLLILGDSSAAGVGAESLDESLLGQVVGRLTGHRRVEFELVARTGARTSNMIKSLNRKAEARFDVAVTALGVNDVTAGISMRSWLGQQSELISILRTKFGARVILSGLPPVSGFSSLPQPLRWYLGQRARQFSEALRHLGTETGSAFIPLDFTDDVSLMASDGFHPGPQIYSEWGRRVAEQIAASG